MPTYTAEELILAAILEEKRRQARQNKANKGKATHEKAIIPPSLQRAFNDL